jgi:hypothetical protein
MKLATAAIIAKGFCVTFGAFCLALSGSLGQWVNAGDTPSPVEWIIIGSTSVGAGVAALGGFLSSAFGKWLGEQPGANGNGNGKPPDPPPKP